MTAIVMLQYLNIEEFTSETLNICQT